MLKRRTSIIRIIISSLIGGVSSLLLFTSMNKILIEILSIIIITIISFKYNNILYTIKNIFYMYIVSTLLGGILYLFNIKINNSIVYYAVIIIIGIEVTMLYIKEIHNLKNNYNNYYQVDIHLDKDFLSLVGFVDTGNNLYDPYKHRPIILVNKKYKRDGKSILVPYHTASGEGVLTCIKPKYITVNNNKITDVLVGFSDNINLIDGVDVILHKSIVGGE